MKMTQTIDPGYFDQKVRQIRAQVSAVLKKRGLLPRFKRWRLAQDSSTGMVVLFGILNNAYIAAHTIIPFSDYFDSRLLHDLANELQLQVVSCNTDGLRYAFILDRGQFDRLPTHIDYPFIDDGELLVRVVYDNHPQPVLAPSVKSVGIDDQALVREGVGAFLKVFDDIKLRNDAATLQFSTHTSPNIVLIDENEFNKRVTEHEANRQRRERIQSLIGSLSEEKR
jgi:hypothetical protein